MLLKNFQFKIKNIGMALSLVFGLMLVSAVSASAQYYPQNPQTNRDRRDDRRDNRRERRDDYNRNRDNDRRNNGGYYGNNGYGNNGYNIARQEGFRDGLRAGADDARDGDRYKPQSHSDYKKGTDGYNSRYGNKGQYKQAYRDAFLQGYSQGYNRNGYRNNNGRRDY